MPAASYVLTPTARQHLREAKAWSRARWGQELTNRYFLELDQAARYIADNHPKFAARPELTGGSGLGIYPVWEHYIIYEPISPQTIAIVAFIRQGRDIPTLLSRHALLFKRELDAIQTKFSAS